MQWKELCERKELQDLPYKIETNKWGQIIMSPAKLKHSFYQRKIANLLETLMGGGKAIPEAAIQTTDGVKVADVAWMSDRIYNIILEEDAASIAPEICVEFKSGSNIFKEMEEKKNLYLAAGAMEVWLCNEAGEIKFLNSEGEFKKSVLAPDFPNQIIL